MIFEAVRVKQAYHKVMQSFSSFLFFLKYHQTQYYWKESFYNKSNLKILTWHTVVSKGVIQTLFQFNFKLFDQLYLFVCIATAAAATTATAAAATARV